MTSQSPERVRAPSLSPTQAAAALANAQMHWSRGDARQAETLCKKILAAYPAHADTSHLRGLIAHAQGNFDLALVAFRDACRRPGAPALYFSNLAEMCRRHGLLEEAEAAARAAIAIDAGLMNAWNNLGIILQEADKLDESRRCLERVLANQPGNPQACNNLGNTCQRLGLLAEAEHYLSRAIALQPDYAEPLSNLAILLTNQCQYERAIATARRAIAIAPRYADAYVNLASAHLARLQRLEALQVLDQLLAFAPDNVAGHSMRATVLTGLDRPEEALAAAHRAARIAPSDADAQNALGRVLQERGGFDDALAAFEAAASGADAKREGAMVNRAVLFMEHGKAEQAGNAFAQVLDAFPTSASAWFNRADFSRFSPDDPGIAAMQALLSNRENRSRTDQMLLHFALGKAYLDIGDSDRAFLHLNQGNAIKRATIAFDGPAVSTWMAGIAETFSHDLLQRLGGGKVHPRANRSSLSACPDPAQRFSNRSWPHTRPFRAVANYATSSALSTG